MPETLLPIWELAKDRETWVILICLLLIGIVDRRIVQVVKCLERVDANQQSHNAHQTARMGEIRNAMMRIARALGKLEGE